MRIRIIVLFAALLISLVAVSPARANAPIIVNSSADVPDFTSGTGVCETNPGNNICTLRAAIQTANTQAGADTIVLQANTTYLLTRVGNDDNSLNGDLDITQSLTISGAGAASTIIDGNGGVTGERVFHLIGASGADISGLTIRNGNDDGGGGIYKGGGPLTLKDIIVSGNSATEGGCGCTPNGGGIYNSGGTVTLTDSTVSGNMAANGGGIYNSGGTVMLTDSTVSGNTASNGAGGGIFNSGGAVTLTDSTVSGNTAASEGGGIYTSDGTVTLTVSTVSGNSANFDGGGIYNSGGIATVTLTNSTVSGNSAEMSGGGIYIYSGTVNLYNVTIASNTADIDWDGGGFGGGIYRWTGAVNMRNTILADNRNRDGTFLYHYDDCAGTLDSEDYNLIQTAAGCTIIGETGNNITDLSPGLDPLLRNNSGPTQTRALLSGSPAINSGNPSGCLDALGATLTTDQRGFPRPAGGVRCDIGAYEFGATIFLPLVLR